jgi:hypothetical protein
VRTLTAHRLHCASPKQTKCLPPHFPEVDDRGRLFTLAISAQYWAITTGIIDFG